MGRQPRKRLAIGAAALALLCSSCVEHQVKSRGATGVVLDKATQLPVRDAKVSVSEFCYYDENRNLSNVMKQVRKPTTTTDGEGFFAVPPKYRWTISIPPFGDYWPPTGTLLIQRSGYSSEMFPVSGVISTDMISTNGRVMYRIEPQPQPSTR